VSGDTLTSGVPAVRPDADAPFPAGPGAPGPSGPAGTPPGAGAPAPAPAPRPAPAPPAKKKGRSKLVLLCVALVGGVGIAYGAGLLLNHSDVPKSTTVLGVDIGGGTRDQAVDKLEGALGKRSVAPLQLSVGGKKTTLAPEKAGLSLDAQTTVRNAAGSDYNPMSVIGSLFGGERVAQPEIVIDEEKLRSALGDLAGDSGSAVESRITFEPGEVVVVPGKAGQGLDVDRSLGLIKDAYRAQIESGRTSTVELPATARQPAVSAAELARAKKEFADPAMSGLITIKAGGREIDFGPNRSLPRILSMKPVDGRLVEVYNKEAITELVGGTFQGVLITKG
ncbi:peptidoglycan binding domain-containing protein, partial [Streptomyces sp. NPDC058953]